MALKDTYMTISEAAKFLEVSRQTIYRWITSKKISTEKIGGVILLERKAITEHAFKEWSGRFRNMMEEHTIEYIMGKYKLGNKDVIEKAKSEDDCIVYVITRNNGTKEKILIGGLRFTATVGRRHPAMQLTDIQPIDICKKVIKRTKAQGRGRKGK